MLGFGVLHLTKGSFGCRIGAVVTCVVLSANVMRADYFEPNTMLLAVGTTTASGCMDMEYFGNGFGDLLIADMLALKDKDPHFQNCDMVMLEWRRRAAVLRAVAKAPTRSRIPRREAM